MFNKNLFNCIKLSATTNLDDNSIINEPTKLNSQSTQQWSISLRNKLKKKFNSSLKRIHRKRLDKSVNKDSGLNLSENNIINMNRSLSKSSFDSNLLSSTKYVSTTLDYLLHEGFFSDCSDYEDDDYDEDEEYESDESFNSLSSLSSISSSESINESRNNNKNNDSKTIQEIKPECRYAKRTRFHPLISSSKVSLNINNSNDSISSDIAFQRKLTPFKTSSRKSLLLNEDESKIKLTEMSISSSESINLSRIASSNKKCYSFYFNSGLDESNAVCSSTLLSCKPISFNEFIKNEIYSNYFM